MENVMKNSGFYRLFLHELKGIYWLECNWITALEEMKALAASEELTVTFRKHHVVNQKAVHSLTRLFDQLEEPVPQIRYAFADGLIADVRQMLTDTGNDGMVRDAGLIIAAQKVAHYTIAAYGSLVTFARIMDHQQAEQLLQQLLDDKKNSDAELTALAENYINLKAVQA